MKFRVIATAVLATLISWAAPVVAQDHSSTVVVLKFATFDVEQDVMDHFYMELHEHIRAHEEMSVAAGGEVTIENLILMVGCDSPTPECLAGAQDFVEGDRIVFGSVQHADGVYLFSMQMYDFHEMRFIREVSDQTIEADHTKILVAIPSVIEGLLYGPVGRMKVSVAGTNEAVVFLNGQEVGPAPQTLENVTLGEQLVTVRTPDGLEKSQSVIVRRNDVQDLSFEFEVIQSVRDPGVATSTSPMMIPGFVAVGVGVTGIVVGLIGQSSLSASEEEANSFVAGRSALGEGELSRAEQLQSDMDSAHTMRVVGFSVGGLALAAGGYMLFSAFTGGSADAPPQDGSLSLQLAPTRDGFGVGMGLKF